MVEWRIETAPVEYETALAAMDERARAIHEDGAEELVWLLEHPPLYTAGTSADPADLLTPDRFPVFNAGRGGEYTYHGPGQRIAYVMLDLSRRGRDVRDFVCRLENWAVAALQEFGITGIPRPAPRIGVWVDLSPYGRPGKEAKIAALGVRVRRWVTLHGLSINVAPNLDHFAGIVPCGVRDYGVTSLADLGLGTATADLDRALINQFEPVFGRAAACAVPESQAAAQEASA